MSLWWWCRSRGVLQISVYCTVYRLGCASPSRLGCVEGTCILPFLVWETLELDIVCVALLEHAMLCSKVSQTSRDDCGSGEGQGLWVDVVGDAEK